MKISVRYCGVLAVLAFSAAHGNAPTRMGAYDFSYDIAGDYRVRPVQVFDNGSSTFFQFRPGEPIPAIFVYGPTGPVMQTPEMEGPYTRVGGVSHNYALRMGYGQGTVTYAGTVPPAGVAQPARTATVGANFAQVVLPGAQQQTAQPVQPQRPRAIDRMIAVAGGLENMPRSVLEEQPQPRIAVDVNSYAVPVKGDIAQFQPTGQSPVVAAGSAYAPQVAVTRGVGRSDRPGNGATNYGGVQGTLKESNIQFAIGQSKLGQKGSDAIRSIAKSHTTTSRYEVIGRYDANYKEGVAAQRAAAVVEMLVAQGVPRAFITSMTTESLIPLPQAGVTTGATVTVRNSGQAVNAQAFVDTTQIQEASLGALAQSLRDRRISASQAAARVEDIQRATAGHYVQPIAGFQEAQISRWSLRAVDGSVQGVLNRWARDAGWQLIWKNGPDIRITGDSELIRDGFVSAADYLISQSRSFGHRIKAHAYNNKVMVITGE